MNVEQLEDRTVPAIVLDLTSPGAAGAINGAIFEQGSTQPAGCGVIHDFLRVQAKHADVEQGYNSDFRPVQFDEKTDHTFTRSLQLSELETVTINGSAYRVFLLGINQKHSSPLLSLDELRLYVSNSGNLTGYDPTTHQLDGQDAVYDMTSNDANWVKLDASLSHGNGSSDMLLFVRDSVLTASSANPFVYLYCKFGENYGCNGGFEAWAPGHGPIVAPATLGGFAYQDANFNKVFDSGDSGIAGIVITLSGINNQGQQVTMTTTTAADGSYFFVGFQSGTYTLTEGPPPASFTQEVSNVGTVDGNFVGVSTAIDTLSSILLGDGQSGLNYNFGLTVGGGGGGGPA